MTKTTTVYYNHYVLPNSFDIQLIDSYECGIHEGKGWLYISLTVLNC